eukprot:Rhum_TRINITY_DN14491_c0_g1::Rhum_TRINITY_DN14491_c0_g1_i1::g.91124::m.91124
MDSGPTLAEVLARLQLERTQGSSGCDSVSMHDDSDDTSESPTLAKVMQGLTRTGWMPGNRKSWMIRSANITSFFQRSETVFAWRADCIALQETWLMPTGQKDFTAMAWDAGWQTFWGAGVGLSATGVTQRGGEHKGVGFLVPRNVPARLVQPRTAAAAKMTKDARLVQCKIAIGVGRTWVHVLNFYAPVTSSYATAFGTREQMFTDLIEEAASLGNVPVLLVGDWNVTPCPMESPTLTMALASGWLHDCAVMSADAQGVEPEPTATTHKEDGRVVHSRLDLIWANSTAAAALLRCHVATGVQMPVHRPVDAVFDWKVYAQPVLKLFSSKKFDLIRAPSKELRDEAKELATRQYRAFKAAPPEDIHQTMLSWSRDAELVCERFATGDVSRALGKGRSPNFQSVHLEGKQTGALDGVTTPEISALIKLEHQLNRIMSGLKRDGIGLSVQEEHTLVAARRRAAKLLDLRLPDFVDEECISRARVACWDKLRRARDKLHARRAAAVADNTRLTFARTPGAVFRKARGATVRSSAAVATVDGLETSNISDIHEQLSAAWKDIFCTYASEWRVEPEYEAFRSRYAEHIQSYPYSAEPVTAADLRDTLSDMPSGKASGPDGWFVEELRLLPDIALERLAEILNRVEVEGVWPESLTHAVVAMIPKVACPMPREHRPIALMSVLYRLWSKMRCAQLMSEWQESWIGSSMHGFRRRHGAVDEYLHTALLMERALLQLKPLHGAMLDIQKCFDSVPWSIAFGLLRDMGLDARITRPLEAMYRSLQRRLRVAGTVGEAFVATNGILQGCPLSVLVINAVVAVWDRAIRASSGCVTGCYADDTKVLSSEIARVQKALDDTQEFGALTGLRYDKCVAFSAGSHLSTYVEPSVTMYGEKLPVTDRLTDLGAEISCATGDRTSVNGPATARVLKAAALPYRIAFMPGANWTVRSRLTMAMVMPMALYGVETANPSPEAMRQLTWRSASGLMGKDQFAGRHYRCSALVTSLLCPGYRTDPWTIVGSRRVLTMARALKSPRLARLVREVHELTRVAPPRTTYGPVTLLHDYCKSDGRGWRWRTLERIDTPEGPIVLSEPDEELRPKLLLHQFREAARGYAWRKTGEMDSWMPGHHDPGTSTRIPRRDTPGIAAGLDYKLVTSVVAEEPSPYRAQLMRSILVGAQVTLERVYRESLRKAQQLRARQSGTPPPDPSEEFCQMCKQVPETMEHMWWLCPKTQHIRERYPEVCRLQYEAWPPCLMRNALLPCGFEFLTVAPENTRKIAARLLHMYTDIAEHRTALATGRVETATTLARVACEYPWGWRPGSPLIYSAQELGAAVPDVFMKNVKPSQKRAAYYTALVGYLQQLGWAADPPEGINGTTWAEIVLDFEVATGQQVLGATGKVCESVEAKVNSLLPALRKLREGHGEAHVYHGSEARNRNALLVAGANSMGTTGKCLPGGVTARCVFLGGRATEDRIRAMCKAPVYHKYEPPAPEEAHICVRPGTPLPTPSPSAPSRQVPPPNLDVGRVLMVDGGSRGNGTDEQPSGVGAVLYQDGEPVWENFARIPNRATNNVAEYVALLIGLAYVSTLDGHPPRPVQPDALPVTYPLAPREDMSVEEMRDPATLRVFGDSKTVRDQVVGWARCTATGLVELWVSAKDYLGKLLAAGWNVTLHHVHREHNTYADRLSNRGMDSHFSSIRQVTSFLGRGEPEARA